MKNINIKIVKNEQELNSAIKIRKQVFVMEQGVSQDLEVDEYDSDAVHIIADYRGEIIATCRLIFLPDKCVKLERMAVLKPFRKKGIGRQILSFVDSEMNDQQKKQIIIHAQCQAARFYESFGFQKVGLPFWEAGIEHIIMRKSI